MARSSAQGLAKALILPVTLVVLWELVARTGGLPSSQSAAPSIVFARLFSLLAQGVLTKQLLLSMARLVGGIVVGTGFGIISGVILAALPRADRFFSPTIQFLAGMPVVVWMPFWIVFFGSGEVFKIGLAATATFFIIHIHAFLGARVVALKYLELAEIYEKSTRQKILDILLPAALTNILTAMRIAFAIGWIVIFFVEYAATREGAGGLGWFVADARQVGRIEDEFAGLLLLGMSGYVVDLLLSRLQKTLTVWSESSDSTLMRDLP